MSSEKKDYESSLIGLAKHYGSFYEDPSAALGEKTWNFIIDPETHEMLHVQIGEGFILPDLCRCVLSGCKIHGRGYAAFSSGEADC